MKLFDGNGNQVEVGGTESTAKTLYSAPNRIVTENAVLAKNAVNEYDGVNVVEYHFPAGSVFWLGETQSGVSTYWLYPNQIDFTVGDTPPSGNILERSYYGSIFLSGCRKYGGEYVTANETNYVFTALKDLYLYLPDTVVIVCEPTEDFISAYGGHGYGIGTTESGFLLWADGYTTNFTRQTTKDHIKVKQAEVKNAENFRAVKRTVNDGELHLFMAGDSIIAGISCGIENAYRTIVPSHFNAPNGYLAASGATTTTGYGMTWGDDTGYAGFSTKLDAIGVYQRNQYDLVIYAVGTNDWGNNVPLGTIDDSDDTTFYGALKMTYDKLMESFPNASFIVILPFKRENWNTQNEAGYYLEQYCQAIYEVLNLRKYRHFYALDLFDKWFLDWDNEVMRSHWFIDYVHPTANAHKCIAKCLSDRISEVIAIEGIKKIVPAE